MSHPTCVVDVELLDTCISVLLYRKTTLFILRLLFYRTSIFNNDQLYNLFYANVMWHCVVSIYSINLTFVPLSLLNMSPRDFKHISVFLSMLKYSAKSYLRHFDGDFRTVKSQKYWGEKSGLDQPYLYVSHKNYARHLKFTRSVFLNATFPLYRNILNEISWKISGQVCTLVSHGLVQIYRKAVQLFLELIKSYEYVLKSWLLRWFILHVNTFGVILCFRKQLNSFI